MPRYAKVSNQLLKKIEESIYQHILSNIENIVANKCKENFEQRDREIRDSLGPLHYNNLKSLNLKSIQDQLKIISDQSDHTLGSLTYLSEEYDEFSTQMHNLSSENLILKKEIKYLKKTGTDSNSKFNSTELKLDGLEQYGRRENLEIHSASLKNGENTNDIVMKLAENLNVKLDNRAISTSHRILTNGKSDFKLNSPPLIIVRFSNGDKRNKIYN